MTVLCSCTNSCISVRPSVDLFCRWPPVISSAEKLARSSDVLGLHPQQITHENENVRHARRVVSLVVSCRRGRGGWMSVLLESGAVLHGGPMKQMVALDEGRHARQ